MKRSTTNFVCQECGYDTPKFLGKCPECGEWNTLKEFQISNVKSKISNSKKGYETSNIPHRLSEITEGKKQRLLSGFSEMDSVLGGADAGFVAGSATLLAGDPGIGKSTLLLQIALNISSQNVSTPHPRPLSTPVKQAGSFQSAPKGEGNNADAASSVLYISGEESEEQIKMRALRLSKKQHENLFLLSISDTDRAVQIIAETKPDFVIVDSIQTMESENLTGLSGSVGQVRYAALQFIRVAKSLNIPVVLVGHVTKEGMVAGPMVLSHMVDTVLFLEGEKLTSTRILRSLKNRFGPVDEVGIFLMDENGMKEATNPEQIFLTKERANAPGSSLVVTLEGTRAFLVELQALVVSSKMPMPRRVVSGIDQRRVELLLAVLQKHCRLPVENMDVFVNVAGGLKISDPAIDLGICLAIFSSFKNVTLSKIVGIAEVGLLGELRGVSSLEKRIKEAKKLGFKQIISCMEYKTLGEVIGSLAK